MTTAEARPTDDPAVQPALAAIHHVGITVTDLEASAVWYERVFGFRRQFQVQHFGSDAGGYTIVLGPPDSSFTLGLDHHPANPGDGFDATRTGLDHLSFAVASVEALHAWVAHLHSQDVPNSGVYDMDGFPVSLVTFCDPDGVQLELIASHG